MVNDIKMAQELAKTDVNNQIIAIRYEDTVKNQTETAELLYHGLGIGEVPTSVKNYITSLSDGSAREEAFGTRRKDSIATAFKWKTITPFNIVKKVDSHCKEVYKLAGYKPILRATELQDPNDHHMIEDHNLL